MFQGLYVALVTPFHPDGSLNEASLRKLVSLHVKNGTDGLVPCGTTGENPTFSVEEHCRVIDIVVQESQGRLKVLAGAGSNSTDKAIELGRRAVELGADGLLVITPYYNKPQQDGLVAHFEAVAAACDAPIVTYNVPGRTGVNLLPQTVERLCDVPNIVGIKEASGDINQVSEIIRRCGDRMRVLSGDDTMTLPIMAVGGTGVISVAGNVVPDRMKAMVDAALEGDWEGARAGHLGLFDLCKALFIETNPVPTKYVMNRMGLDVGNVRLPLAPLREASAKHLDGIMRAYGITSVSVGS